MRLRPSLPLTALAFALAAVSCDHKAPAPPGTDEAAEKVHAVAEQVKSAANDLAAKAEKTTQKAGDQIAAGAHDLSDRTGGLLDRLGDQIKSAGQQVEHDTADGRDRFAEKTRETVDDIRRWFDDSAKPTAEKGGDKLRDQIHELSTDLDRKLDRLKTESGPTAEQTRRDIRAGLEKLRAKLREAKDRALH